MDESRRVTPRVARKLARAKRFAKAIVQGANQTEAALAAGVTPASARVRGSEMIKTPEVQRELDAFRSKLENAGLGEDRAIEELDRGLRQAKLGQHSDYLDKHLRLLGKLQQNAAPKNVIGEAVIQSLVIEAQKRGLA